MSRIGLLGSAFVLLVVASPANAAFVEASRFDMPTGLGYVAVSASGDAVYGGAVGDSGGGFRHVAADGSQVANWTSGGRPLGMAVEASGNLLVANAFDHQIVRYSPSGSELGRIGSEGQGAGKFHNPNDVAVGPGGDIYVADGGNNRIE